MKILLSRNGLQEGPYSFDEVRGLAASGSLHPSDHAWYQGCTDWIRVALIPGIFPPGLPQPADADELQVRRIGDYVRLSGIFWIVLGGLQILSVIGIIAGIWNIFAGITRLSAAKRIMARDPRVIDDFRGIAGLVVIAAVNLLLGGVIGVVFAGFDFVIRDKILSNTRLFEGDPARLPG